MKKNSILIVDDSKFINNSLYKSLQNRGYDVTQAFSAIQAKEILQENSFDYVLLDLELSDGVGEDLLPSLQVHEEIKVIILTSDKDKQRREYLFSFGIVVDYIIKERYFADMELSIVKLIEMITTNRNLNILIADDSSFMRTHLTVLLTKRGFNVYSTHNGKEALGMLKIHKIDAAIIDLEMPVMDGNKLLLAIKRDKANLLLPVMVISGTNDPDKIARVIKNGASDFIKKPYAHEELLLKIDKMIQELKQQRVIKSHENRFALYNRAINDTAIFFKLDSEFNIIFANNSLSELLFNQVTFQENISFLNYLDSLNEEQINELKQTLVEGKTFQNIFSIKNDASQRITLRLTLTPILNESNLIDEIIVIGFDVSLLQEKEEDLKQKIQLETKKNWEQNKMLIQQSKMASMGEMIEHIGHQWRQPLNSLNIMFQRLNMAYQRDKLSVEIMDSSTKKAMRIISHMSKTIDDFRNFFKSDKEKVKCKASEVVQLARNIIEPTLISKKIDLVLHIENEVSFLCLENELSQVILNIIANGMDAIIDNEIQNGMIDITLDVENNYVTIVIDDNAGGIPLDIIDRIFEPYFTTKQTSNGTGIGLYMSKTIIEEHLNGELHVMNSLSGASFKILIPIEGDTYG